MTRFMIELAGRLQRSALVALMIFGATLMLRAAVTVDETSTPNNGATSTSAAAAVADSGSKDVDDDDDDKDNPKHTHIEIHADNALESDLIPIMGILATFGTPVLIVFFVCYFKYRRRRENVVLAQEYLNKGLPVPPQLLDDGQGYFKDSGPTNPSSRCQSDLRRGFKLAFVGLGLTIALYFNERHSTTWAWGLIPLIMGLGYLISGWVESRQQARPDDSRTPPAPPRNPLS